MSTWTEKMPSLGRFFVPGQLKAEKNTGTLDIKQRSETESNGYQTFDDVITANMANTALGPFRYISMICENQRAEAFSIQPTCRGWQTLFSKERNMKKT